jgi:hypothetical protein
MEPKMKVRCFRNGATSSISDPLVVAAKDHSRRLQRVFDRAMKGHPTHVTVQAARYSSFDPDQWWETRGGR